MRRLSDLAPTAHRRLLAVALCAGCAGSSSVAVPPPEPNATTLAYGTGNGDDINALMVWGWLEEGTSGSGFGKFVSYAGDVDGDGYDDLIVGDNTGGVSAYLGGPYGLQNEPWWTTTTSGGSEAQVAGGGDVDGDGYDDVAVGDTSYSGTYTSEGIVDLYLGSAAGPSTSSDWSYACGQAGAACGAVAVGGDVDGDGYADLLIGAAQYDGSYTDAGAIFLFYGSATGPASTADWSYSPNQTTTALGASVAFLGDVNGDGYDDIGTGAATWDDSYTDEGAVFAWYGDTSGPASSPDFTAYSGQASAALSGLSAAGDLDGDGYDDAVAGAPKWSHGSSTEGLVVVYSGSSSGLAESWTYEPDRARVQLGGLRTLGTAGDVDGDGYDDLLVGDPRFYVGSLGSTLNVFLGSSSGLGSSPDLSWRDSSDKDLGYGVASGDFDADGYSDAVGGSYSDDFVWALYGSEDGLVTGGSWFATLTRTGETSLGMVLGSGGDVDGDGYEDLLVSSDVKGDALAFLGSSSGPSSSYDTAMPGFGPGYAMVGGFDLNGDGYDDVLVGDGSGYGAIRLYTGSSSGLSSSRYTEITGSTSLAGFGYIVAAPGDIDGDGYDDVVVGAPQDADGEYREGLVYAFYGASGGIDTTPDWSFESDQAYALAGSWVAAAGDVDADGYDDLLIGASAWAGSYTYEGAIWLFSGSSTGLGSSAAWTMEGGQTTAQCHRGFGVGDVNGDGYDDVIVGCANYDVAGTDDGKVDLYLGSSSGLATSAAWTASGPDDGVYWGDAVTGLGDIDGDGYDDVAVSAFTDTVMEASEGTVYIYRGTSDGLEADPAVVLVNLRTRIGFGYSLAGGLDTDGDGVLELWAGTHYYSKVYAWEFTDADEDGSVWPIDCNDADADIHPGAIEACDGIDNDCDGAVDETIPTWYPDDDGDGFGDASAGVDSCTEISGYVSDGSDCDDDDSDVNPEAVETCNAVDDDCDGEVDESDASDAITWFADTDVDGFGDPDNTTSACSVPSGYSSDDTDCDDLDATVYPGADELCDGTDHDCDGATLEDDSIDAPTWYADTDADGYGDSGSTEVACSAPSGYVSDDSDCDDGDSDVHPGAAEWCDAVDQDCDGVDADPDSVDASTWFADRDADGFGDAAAATTACTQPSGYLEDDTDCDDTTAAVYPGADEYCDGADHDCDGATLEDDSVDAPTWYADTDGDGFGDAAQTTRACAVPTGYTGNDTDCDDADPATHPTAPEVWYDGIDQACDGGSDYDADGDGQDSDAWGGADCDDTDPEVYAGAPDDPYDGKVTDCDSSGDYDADGDGYLSDAYGGDDCDDADPDVNPGVDEIWYDGLDQNCDDASDYDRDGDGLDAASFGGTDCDDSDSEVYPGATEIWYDGVDQNCDGRSDFDADGDGEDSDRFGGLDCDDNDARVGAGGLDCEAPGGCGCRVSPTGGSLAWLAFLLPVAALRRAHRSASGGRRG